MPSLKPVHRFPIPGAKTLGDTPRQVALEGELVIERSSVGVIQILDSGNPAAPRILPGNFSDFSLAEGGRIWAVQQGTGLVQSFESATGAPSGGPSPLPSRPPPDLVAVSGDGATLVTVAGDPLSGQTIRVEDAATRRAVRTIEGLSADLTAVAASPGGERIVTGSRIGALTRWDAQRGELEGVSRAESAPALALSFDDAGAALAVVRQSPFVDLIEPARGRTVRRWKAHTIASFAAFIPKTGELVTTGNDGVVAKWTPGPLPPPPPGRAPARPVEGPPPPGGPIGQMNWPIQRAALAPDGSLLAVSGAPGVRTPAAGFAATGGLDATLGAVSLADGKTLWDVTIPKCDPTDRFVGVSPDNKNILFATRELMKMPNGQELFIPTLRIYDARTGALGKTLRPETTGPIASLGTTVLVGGTHPVMYTWPAQSERARVQTTDTVVRAIATLPSRGLFILAGDSGATTLVSAKTGRSRGDARDAERRVRDREPRGRVPLEPRRRAQRGLGVRRAARGLVVRAIRRALRSARRARAEARRSRPAPPRRRSAGRRASTSRPAEARRAHRRHRVHRARLGLVAGPRGARARLRRRPPAAEQDGVRGASADGRRPAGAAGKNRVSVVAYDADGFASNAR